MDEKTFRVIACGLLAGILLCQIAIISKLPPTLGELMETAKGEQKKQLMMKAPIIHAQINEPLQVDIVDTPVSVTIEP